MIQFGPYDNLTRQILAQSNMRSTAGWPRRVSKSCHLASGWSHQGKMGGLPSLTEKQHQRERVVLQMHQNHSLRPSLPEGVFSGSCHLAEEASEKIGGLNHNILSGVSPAAICRLLGAAALLTFLSHEQASASDTASVSGVGNLQSCRATNRQVSKNETSCFNVQVCI